MNWNGKMVKRGLSALMAVALVVSSMVVTDRLAAQDNGTNIISIGSAAALAKIGVSSGYPLDGNYKLTTDIDLSGVSWTPIGGYYGEKGRVSGDGVFTGTFDGQGHVISGLNMNYSGDIPNSSYYAELGLFGVIGSGDASDYAIVRNIIFTDVDIRAEFTNALCSAGTLAGDVNGYAQVENIAVLNGSLYINTAGRCDTVGAGGIIGECRTDNNKLSVGNRYVTIRNMYNGADVSAAGTNLEHNYTGGILGRVAKTACKEVSSCVNTGTIQYDGDMAYGISAVELNNTNYYSNFSNCYVLEGYGIADGGKTVSQSSYISGTLLSGLSQSSWTARKGFFQVPSICLDSSASGYIYMSGITPVYSVNDSATHVTDKVTLPASAGSETLTWTSSDTSALKIDGSTAVPAVDSVIDDTYVTLTCRSSSGYTRNFKLKVISNNKMSITFNTEYASVGKPLTVVINNQRGLSFNYAWSVDGKQISGNANSYTPQSSDIEKFIKVIVTSTDGSARIELNTYLSELPVVYVNTNDGAAVTSTNNAKDATFKVQGNSEYNDASTYYDGDCTIKGRGNSTWSMAANWGVKKPYKIKLGKKANLLGMGTGKNKHWVLLANMIDHTNIRNELTYNFSRDIGMEYSPATANVVLILNGEYVGLYQLCEHVRIGTSRVNIFDWEEQADDIADAIAKAENLDAAALETVMEQDFSWRTSLRITYGSKTYYLNDYYDTSTIPEFTGGFLMDMDFRISNTSKYVSSFRTTMHGNDGIPMFFRSPEYAKTDSAMVNYVRNFLDTYENAINSEDFCTNNLNNQTEIVHYTDLFDMDSLVKNWLVCEFTMNWDSMKNSTYLYKDITGKAKMGPVWDYDWAFGNINMYSGTSPFVITGWHSTCDQFCEQAYQHYQWNRYLITDPYFALKAYQLYSVNRSTVIEDIIKSGGILDSSEAKYQTASDANDRKWGSSYNNYSGKAIDSSGNTFNTKSQKYNDAFTSLRQYINKRITWMDDQFKLNSGDADASIKNLFTSFGNKVSDKIKITGVDTSGSNTTTIRASVTDSSISEITFQVNGTNQVTEKVNNSSAQAVIGDNMLNTGEKALNIVEVHAIDSAGYYIGDEHNFKVFDKTVLPTATPIPTSTPEGSATRHPSVSDAPVPTAVSATHRPTVTMTPTPGPTARPGRATKTPAAAGIPTQSPVISARPAYPSAVPDHSTPTPGSDDTTLPSASPVPDINTPVPASPLPTAKTWWTSDSSSKTKASLRITGKSKVKAGGSITLKIESTGLTGRKFSWSLNSKGKKLFRLSKKSGKKIRLSTKKGKKGKGTLTVKCGTYTAKKIIRIS